MIDFIKLYWKDKSLFEPFVCHKDNFENLYVSVEGHTGEMTYPYKTNLENMNIVVSSKSGYVRGSIHKLYNLLEEGETHNYNDLTYSMMCESIDYITSHLTDTENAGITQLEFGLNINTNIPAEEIIRRNVRMHKYAGYNHNRSYRGGGQLKQFDHYNYVLKIYDKAKQFKLQQNLLRIELKFLNRKEFQKTGIYNISDLKDKPKLRGLFSLLLKRFDELIIIDDIPGTAEMPKEDINMLNKYSNPLFWEEEIKSLSGQSRMRYREEFSKILEKYDLLNTKRDLRNALIQKFEYLINH